MPLMHTTQSHCTDTEKMCLFSEGGKKIKNTRAPSATHAQQSHTVHIQKKMVYFQKGENKIARAHLVQFMHNSVTLSIYRKNMCILRNKKKSEDADKAPLAAKLKQYQKNTPCIPHASHCHNHVYRKTNIPHTQAEHPPQQKKKKMHTRAHAHTHLMLLMHDCHFIMKTGLFRARGYP